MRLQLACAILCLTPFFVAGAQTAAPSFDVASIKPTPPLNAQRELDGNGRPLPPPPSYFGPLEFTPGNVVSHPAGIATRQMIVEAYRLMPGQLAGEPSWVNVLHFDVAAKANRPADDDQLRLMLQTLLAERFHLVAHHETRTMRVDFLYPAKRGVKFHAWKAGDPLPSINPGGHEHALLEHGPTSVLTRVLASSRPVVDRLGMGGSYLYFVRWDDMYPGVLRGNAVKQLGLKLKSGIAPVDVLVIDRIDKPDAN